ncbi:hypothetical protein COCNU_01G010590 [Cocos nucifera]|uniref:CTLH domain-containing protein n=1 Tax=Cocos nucifera TaxID=13894 RepID=A0A8K0HVX1_COCNU|nr:hypothetical protein COCNU_01G010590 [Cocos nucifera]
MSSISRDLIFLVLQYLHEEKYKEAAHKLEEESGIYFNMWYFEESVLAGNWEEAERYLSGFTKFNDNRHSTKIYFEIRKQKYLEALDRHDKGKALDILVKDLRVSSTSNEKTFQELTLLLSLDNFRENEDLSEHGDTQTARVMMMAQLKRLIEANPRFKDKLQFPVIKASRLRTLINQSLNWQHGLCKYPSPRPNMKTLLVDHYCPQTNVAPGGSSRAVGSSGIAPSQHALGELPRTVAMTLNQDSAVTSMDFHPAQPTILLVGTTAGEISLWNVASMERIAHISFEISIFILTWFFGYKQKTLARDPTVSVNRVIWNFDGIQFGMFKKKTGLSIGVAYSQHLVHLFTYNGHDGISNHLEIEAHVGGVNDAAYSQPNRQVCIVTGGEDKTIKVWEAATGMLRYVFEGHEAPVHSICPHSKANIPFLFSTSLDGKIKAWLYDNMGSRLDYTTPGQWCITLAYSADGTRLFSCGTGKDLIPHIVEWSESKGTIKQTYHGLCKQAVGGIKFDTIKNQFLAAGDDYMVKFWDVDNANLLTVTDADGGLPASPCIRSNKDGSLLAVSANNNRIKILANIDGQRLLSLAARSASESIPQARAINPLESVSAMAGTSASGADKGAPMATAGALAKNAQTIFAAVSPLWNCLAI